ncbi:MAG: hypothetical protein PHO91_01595 [Patescibacteria group bacterium]|nr:hypothetical protein [Patescibacteria group bacterium]
MNKFEQAPVPNEPEKKGILDSVRSRVQEKMQESHLPTKEALGYESTVGVYGGKVNYDGDRMVFDMRGMISKVDRMGDAVLRTYDEHTVKNPVEMLKKHPRWFFRFLAPGTKRYRGTPEEIAENAKRLGLENEYASHEWGIEIKDPDIYRASRPLQDIFRSDMIEGDDLDEIDRFEALAQSARYIRNIHDEYGAIGEVLPSDIIFRKKEGVDVSEPVLNIPDIVYNKEKQTSEIDKKTTDLLDFTMSIGIEELRRSEDWNETQHAIRTIIDSYDDETAIKMLKSYIKRGRLTMLGDAEGFGLSKTTETLRPLTAIHNKARLNFDKDTTSNLRELIATECDRYLEDSTPEETE